MRETQYEYFRNLEKGTITEGHSSAKSPDVLYLEQTHTYCIPLVHLYFSASKHSAFCTSLYHVHFCVVYISSSVVPQKAKNIPREGGGGGREYCLRPLCDWTIQEIIKLQELT
jgi:hypothetical protein